MQAHQIVGDAGKAANDCRWRGAVAGALTELRATTQRLRDQFS
jgi:hypothetical protein